MRVYLSNIILKFNLEKSADFQNKMAVMALLCLYRHRYMVHGGALLHGIDVGSFKVTTTTHKETDLGH